MTFEAILASCIEAIGHGKSVESCLAAHPEHAERLEPLLRLVEQAYGLPHSHISHAALIEAILASCIEAIEDEASAGYSLASYTGYADRLEPLLRALAQLYNLPQRRMSRAALTYGREFVMRAERKHWARMEQTALTIVPAAIQVRRVKLFLFPTRPQGLVPGSSSSRQPSPRPLRRIYGAGMSMVVTAASLVLVIALVLNTAALSLPGDVYYPIKRGSEEVQGIMIQAFGEPVTWQMSQVERRLQELTIMESGGRTPDPTLVAEVEAEVKVKTQEALAEVAAMPEVKREQYLKAWSQRLQLHQEKSSERGTVNTALVESLAIVESALSDPQTLVALLPPATPSPSSTPDPAEALAVLGPNVPLPTPDALLLSTPSAATDLVADGVVADDGVAADAEELQHSTTSTAQEAQRIDRASRLDTTTPRSQATVTPARPFEELAGIDPGAAMWSVDAGELVDPDPPTPAGRVRIALQTSTPTLVAESPLTPRPLVRATATRSAASSPILLPTVTETPASLPTATVATATARPTRTPTRPSTPLPTNTPLPTATPALSATATASPTELPILLPTLTPTNTFVPTPTLMPTVAPTLQATATPVATDTPILLPTVTDTPVIDTPAPTATATASATLTPTLSSTPLPTDTLEPTDTVEPTLVPTDTQVPAETPTIEPTSTPLPTDTLEPTETAEPTASPTPVPTETPTSAPTDTAVPTETQIPVPTDTPVPTATPTVEPTDTPLPTETPVPTETLTSVPTETPEPTETPLPTETPTMEPTDTPLPTETPTPVPTDTSLPADPESNTETSTPVPMDTQVPEETSTPLPADTEVPEETPTVEPTSTPLPAEAATDEAEPEQP